MPLPVRHLPVLQNWDCHLCGQCCKEYSVQVTEAERQRIDEQGWAKQPEFAGTKLVVRDGFLSDKFRLNHRADGSCVFLDELGRCRIHMEFGGTQKPLACQVYPYVLIPAGDHWRVGVRFACPSASANKGRPVSEQAVDIASFAHQLEEREGVRGRSLKPPRLRGLQRVSWDDLGRFVKAISAILGDSSQTIQFRWRWSLALAGLCRSAKFTNVTGRRLDEFLAMVSPGLAAELGEASPAPSGIGRVLFRLTAAVYSRRDTGAKRGPTQRNRLALLRAAWQFVRGSGTVPKLHAMLPDITFEHMEQPAGPLPPESIELLERYYRTKLESYQFFGPTHFHYKFWDGLDALAMTLPVTLWLSRAFHDKPQADAIETALQIVDDNFGYNTLLGSTRHKWITRLLAGRGEIGKLITWYAR
jgi:lysine-N-methylase